MKTKTKTSPTTTPKGFVPPLAQGDASRFDWRHSQRVRFPKLEAKAKAKRDHQPSIYLLTGRAKAGKTWLAQAFLRWRMPRYEVLHLSAGTFTTITIELHATADVVFIDEIQSVAAAARLAGELAAAGFTQVRRLHVERL